MPFGKITPLFAERISPHIRGKKVYDLGSGDDLSLACALIDLGAKEVVAIDTYAPMQLSTYPVRYVRNYFENVEGEDVEIAFISWPSNRASDGLLKLIEPAKIIIYLGTCMDGTMCGSPELYRYLSTREVFACEPHRANTLIIYGHELPDERVLLPEEHAGIDHSRVHSFEEAYAWRREGLNDPIQQARRA